jgi:hypothetical protein
MKNPKHRPKPKYYTHASWLIAVARFDTQGRNEYVKWFNFSTKKWEVSTKWTFHSLNFTYNGLKEIEPTKKLIRTGYV